MSQHQVKTIWVDLEGNDTADFLHRLTTVDVKRLQLGKGSFGCWLNANGKIELSFFLFRVTASSFSLLAPWCEHLPDAHSIEQIIERAHFGEALTYQIRERTLYVLQSDLRFEALKSGDAMLSEETISIPSGLGFGVTLFSQTGSQQDVRMVSAEGLERACIEFSLPRFGFEIRAGWNPLEVGLDPYLPNQKGCYPGQEVIERIRARGAPSAKLSRLKGNGLTLGLGVLKKEELVAGEVTSAVMDGQGKRIGLGIIKKAFRASNELFQASEGTWSLEDGPGMSS